MEQIKIWLAALASFSILDFLCFSVIAGNFYRQKMAPWARLKADGSVDFSYLAGAIVYGLMALGFMVFVWPKIKDAGLLRGSLYSALFGLVIYGAYDFTNLAFAKYWPPSFAAVDILWGILAFGITGLVVKLLFHP